MAGFEQPALVRNINACTVKLPRRSHGSNHLTRAKQLSRCNSGICDDSTPRNASNIPRKYRILWEPHTVPSTSVLGIWGFMFPNSEPCPLWPLFLPGIRNPRCEDDGLLLVGVSEEVSPNRAKMLFFLGLTSSSPNPTSSNRFSSVPCGCSKAVSFIVDLEVIRESREVRDGSWSIWPTGERAEISYWAWGFIDDNKTFIHLRKIDDRSQMIHEIWKTVHFHQLNSGG